MKFFLFTALALVAVAAVGPVAQARAIELPPVGGACGDTPRYACVYMVIDCTDGICGSATEVCAYWNGHSCDVGTQP
jgi:hypothetical protein